MLSAYNPSRVLQESTQILHPLWRLFWVLKSTVNLCHKLTCPRQHQLTTLQHIPSCLVPLLGLYCIAIKLFMSVHFMPPVTCYSAWREGCDFKFAKIPKGYKVEPCIDECSIRVVKSKKTAFSSKAIWSSFDWWNSLPSFSNKLVLFLMRHNSSVLLLKLAMSSQCTEKISQNGWATVWMNSYHHLPVQIANNNDFSFSKNSLMLFKQRYMQAESESASKIRLNKNNHIVSE